MKDSKHHRGFSLVELLVVVAIIIVPIALLLPVLRAGPDRAKVVKCQANLRQCHTVISQHASDHAGELPEANAVNPYTLLDREWNKLRPYMKSAGLQPEAWYCPSYLTKEDRLSLEMWHDASFPPLWCGGYETNLGYAYVVNPTLNSNGTLRSSRKWIVKPEIDPGKFFHHGTLWMVDVCAAYRPPSVIQTGDDVVNWRSFPHHGISRPEVSNALHGDGSVEVKTVDRLKYSYRFIHNANLYW